MVKFINDVNKAFPIDYARNDVGIIEKMIDANITTINRVIVTRNNINNVLENIKNAINAIEPLICDGSVLRAMFNKI